MPVKNVQASKAPRPSQVARVTGVTAGVTPATPPQSSPYLSSGSAMPIFQLSVPHLRFCRHAACLLPLSPRWGVPQSEVSLSPFRARCLRSPCRYRPNRPVRRSAARSCCRATRRSWQTPSAPHQSRSARATRVVVCCRCPRNSVSSFHRQVKRTVVISAYSGAFSSASVGVIAHLSQLTVRGFGL